MKTNPHALVCPRDRGEMIPMERRSLAVSHCGSCRGMWIPKEQIVGRIDGELIRRLFHAPAKRMAELRCPTDNSPLWEFCADGVLLDRCNTCGGLWFDAGELETVMGKVRFTTSPTVALDLGERRGSKLETLENFFTPDPAVDVGELVVSLLVFLAAALK